MNEAAACAGRSLGPRLRGFGRPAAPRGRGKPSGSGSSHAHPPVRLGADRAGDGAVRLAPECRMNGREALPHARQGSSGG